MVKDLDHRIKEIEQLEEDYPNQRREMIRDLLIKTAVEAAMDVIYDRYKSESEYRYLIAHVTYHLAIKIAGHTASDLLRADLEARFSATKKEGP